MSEPTRSEPAATPATASPRPIAKPPKTPEPVPRRILLVPYPKIVFLYPILLAAVAAGIVMNTLSDPTGTQRLWAVAVAQVFLGVATANLVVLAFDFPRTTSLTLFFCGVAIVLGLVLLYTFQPGLLPWVKQVVAQFHPMANATFYWAVAIILGAIFVIALINVRFDYWEVRPNELLHRHGFLSNLERLSAPHLRIEKEINDIFEYLLLRSGRLILQPSNERRAIVLDNVPFIKRKEEAITRMLGALQVQVRDDEQG